MGPVAELGMFEFVGSAFLGGQQRLFDIFPAPESVLFESVEFSRYLGTIPTCDRSPVGY